MFSQKMKTILKIFCQISLKYLQVFTVYICFCLFAILLGVHVDTRNGLWTTESHARGVRFAICPPLFSFCLIFLKCCCFTIFSLFPENLSHDQHHVRWQFSRPWPWARAADSRSDQRTRGVCGNEISTLTCPVYLWSCPRCLVQRFLQQHKKKDTV